MREYLSTLSDIFNNGKDREDRTGTGTRARFGVHMRFNLAEGFPAVTTKRLAWKSVVSELLWMLEGSTDERRLAEILYNKPRDELIDKTTIWTANADAQGKALGYENTDLVKELGPVYGSQWRNFQGVDQVKAVIQQLKDNPYDRRMIISAWNPAELSLMALPPCPVMIQFFVEDGKLSGQVYQRSSDFFLGIPFDIASYALLIHIFAKLSGFGVGELVYASGDSHIYLNHLEQVQEQFSREPFDAPMLKLPEFSTLEDVLNTSVHDYILENYQCHAAIKAPMAV